MRLTQLLLVSANAGTRTGMRSLKSQSTPRPCHQQQVSKKYSPGWPRESLVYHSTPQGPESALRVLPLAGKHEGLCRGDSIWTDSTLRRLVLLGRLGPYLPHLPPYSALTSCACLPPCLAVHADGSREYDAHNLFGTAMAMRSHAAAAEVMGKRPFMLLR